jgi:hypothetical protein
MMNWQAFEAQYNFKQTLLALLEQSFGMIAKSKFGEMTFSAFALNCDAFTGSLSVSFDTDPATPAQHTSPADWAYEVMECELPEVHLMFIEQYDPMQEVYEELQQDMDDDSLSEGYLHAMREIMVTLENTNAFSVFKTTADFITQVTEIDADTDEEARLLDEVRRSSKV